MTVIFKGMIVYFLIVVAAIFFSGCQPSGETLEEVPIESSTGLNGSPQAPESAQGETKAVVVSISSPSGDTFEENQAASFTFVVSGLIATPRFEWRVDGVKIPDVTQTISRTFSAGPHTIQINLFDGENRLLGSATRIINVTAKAAPVPAPAPAPAPQPTPTPAPTAEVVKNLPLTCATQQLQLLTDLVNQKLGQSNIAASTSGAINPRCPSPIQQPGDIFLTAEAAVRLDSSGGVSLTKITASGLSLPNGVINFCPTCVPFRPNTAWAVLYRADIKVAGTSVEIKNTATNLPFFTQDPSLANRYFIDTTVTGALSGATLILKAVILEFTGFGTVDQLLQPVKKGEAGAQTAEFIIFSAPIP